MKKAFRIILMIAAAVCFSLNISPVFTSGTVNTGVVAGVGFALVCALYSVFFEKVNAFVRKLCSKRAGKTVFGVFVSIALACTVVGCVTLGRIVSYSVQSDRVTDYVIVLGCRVRGDDPGIFLNGRINRAYSYLLENPQSVAILSGGQGDNENKSEAQCMYDVLVFRGVDPDRLIVEDKSASTYENFRFSLEKLREMGVEISEITVVTNDFHEYRAAQFARRAGLEANPYPSKTPFTGYLPFAVREVFAVIWQIYIKG